MPDQVSVTQAIVIGLSSGFLGAAVGGFSSILVAHFNAKTAKEAEYSKRRRDLLQQIAIDLDNVCYAIADLVSKNTGSQGCFADIYSIKSRLVLVSCPEINKAVEDLKNTFSKFHPSSTNAERGEIITQVYNQKLTIERMLQLEFKAG